MTFKIKIIHFFQKSLVLMTCYLLLACSNPSNNSGFVPYAWQFSTPSAANIKAVVLDSAFMAAENSGYMDALLIVRNSYIVREDYFNGYDLDIPHNVKSVSKSFLSLITGVAHEQGYLANLDTTVLSFFPDYVTTDMDTRKFDITVRHLLSMQMGIAPEADNNYELYMQLYNSHNWIRETLALPLVSAPGEAMYYNTFQTHLLSVIITRVTGKSTLKYAHNTLFEKMGIDCDGWEKGPQGYYFGGNSMYFTPREMAVMGQLILNHGFLNGEQIVSTTWIEQLMTKTRSYDVPEWGVFTNYNYGYLWWLGKINEYQVIMALGYAGQTVLVFPELNLVVVTTANEKVMPDVDQERPILKIVSRYILPAIN